MKSEVKINSQNPASNFSWLDVPKAIWYFLEEDKRKFVLAFFTLLIVFAYNLVPPYIVGKVVDFFASYKAGQPLHLFYFYTLFIAITWLVAALIRLKCRNIMAITGEKTRTRARIWGFERLTEFSLEWHPSRKCIKSTSTL